MPSHHHSEPSSKIFLSCMFIHNPSHPLPLSPSLLTQLQPFFGYVTPLKTPSTLLPQGCPFAWVFWNALHRHPWLTSGHFRLLKSTSSRELTLLYFLLPCCHSHRIYCVCCPFPLTRIQPWGESLMVVLHDTHLPVFKSLGVIPSLECKLN